MAANWGPPRPGCFCFMPKLPKRHHQCPDAACRQSGLGEGLRQQMEPLVSKVTLRACAHKRLRSALPVALGVEADVAKHRQPMLLTKTVMVVSLIFGKPWNDWPGHALCPMAPDYRTVPDYRHLQLICERQAVVSVSN